MARKRLIAPSFFTNGDLYDAELAAGLPLRLAFAGLWTVADRRGLFAWKPREIKLAVLPYDDVDMASTMLALCQHQFVSYYEVDGKGYGMLPSFGKWQTFHVKERPDLTIPEPLTGFPPDNVGPKGVASTVLAPCQPSASTPITGTITGTVSTTRATASRPRKTVEGSKFPDFPIEARRELYDVWREKVGDVNMGMLVNAVGPYWTTERGPAVRRAVRDYVALITGGRSAPFASPPDLAKKLGALITNAERNAADAIARSEGAERIIHGRAA